MIGGQLAIVAIPFIIVAVLAIGLSVAAAYLLQPKLKTPLRDDSPSTYAERGTVVPYVIGRRRVGAIIAYVGHSIISHSHSGGKGGGGHSHGFFGGSSPPPPAVYIEEGWHLVATGHVTKLHRIYKSGKVIFGPELGNVPIDTIGFPSGNTLDLGSANGTLRWYWGEKDQPVQAELGDATRVGIASHWPFVCYALWTAVLGPQKQWPVIEYEIESVIEDEGAVPLGGSSVIAFDATVPDPLIITGSVPPGSTVVEHVKGVNLAHAMWQLLCGGFPYGLGLDSALFDMPSLALVAATMIAENIAGSVIIQGGEEVVATIATILQDIGCVLGWDPKTGKIRFKLIRPLETDVAVLPYEVLRDPLPQIEQSLAPRPVDQLVFSYKDFDYFHKTQTIVVMDDGQEDQLFVAQRTRKVSIESVVDYTSAQTIAERRSQEELASGVKYTIKTMRGSRAFHPGRAFKTDPLVGGDGMPLLLRALEIMFQPLSRAVEVIAIPDFYGVTPSTFKPIRSTEAGFPIIFITPADLAGAFFEVPAYLLTSPTGGVVLVSPWIRADATVGSMTINISPDLVTYTAKGTDTDLDTGGILTTAIKLGDPNMIETGPTFSILGPDVTTVPLDLTADEIGWKLGKQLALIDDELFFLRNVVAVDATHYTLKGLIRARYDTKKAAHAIGAKVFIFQDSKIQHTADPMFTPGASISLKQDPTGLGGTLSLASCPVIGPKTIHGKGLVPMDPLNVHKALDGSATSGSPCYKTGADIPLVWNYRSALTALTGAGMQPYGKAALDPSAVDGSFEITFLTTLDVVKKTVSGVVVPSYTLTNADLVAAFGAEVDFHVEVRDTKGGYKSDPAKLTVIKI